MFFKGSRYANVEEAVFVDARGREVRYKKIRFTPKTTGALAHVVTAGERLDGIAAKYYQDPERYWRIADANGALRPEDLEAEPGQTIVIPPSEG